MAAMSAELHHPSCVKIHAPSSLGGIPKGILALADIMELVGIVLVRDNSLDLRVGSFEMSQLLFLEI